MPVEVLRERVEGNPLSDQLEIVANDELSVAVSCRLKADPVVAFWVPGLLTVTALVRFQVKLADPV